MNPLKGHKSRNLILKDEIGSVLMAYYCIPAGSVFVSKSKMNNSVTISSYYQIEKE